MAYPPRRGLEVLPEFAGRTRSGCRVPGDVARFIVEAYCAGRSLREIAELTDRSFSAVRRILDDRDVPRRGCGAAQIERV